MIGGRYYSVVGRRWSVVGACPDLGGSDDVFFGWAKNDWCIFERKGANSG